MNEKLIDKIAQKLKIDAKNLKEALEADKDIELKEYFTQEEVDTLTTNLQKEKYENGKTAGIEMNLKELKKSFKEQYGIETDGIKDHLTLINKVLEIKEAEKKTLENSIMSGVDSQTKLLKDKLEGLEKDKLTLQEKIKHAEELRNKEVAELNNKFKSQKANTLIAEAWSLAPFEVPINIKNMGEKAINDYLQIQRMNAINLYKLEHSIDFDENDMPVLKKGNEIVKDKLQNPVKIQDTIIPFAKEKYLLISEKPSGRGGKDIVTGNISFGTMNVEEFQEYCKEKKIYPGTNAYDTARLEFEKSKT